MSEDPSSAQFPDINEAIVRDPETVCNEILEGGSRCGLLPSTTALLMILAHFGGPQAEQEIFTTFRKVGKMPRN